MSAVVQPARRRAGRAREAASEGRAGRIAILNELDTDPEAEPWLGASEASPSVPQWPCSLANDDREAVDEDGGDILDGGDDDQVDGEPSLGAVEHIDQRVWAQGGRRNLEGDGPAGAA